VGVLDAEPLRHRFIFLTAKGAGAIQQPTARAHQGARGGEDALLAALVVAEGEGMKTAIGFLAFHQQGLAGTGGIDNDPIRTGGKCRSQSGAIAAGDAYRMHPAALEVTDEHP